MLVFGIGGVITYQMVKKEVAKETDHELKHRMKDLQQAIREGIPLNLLESKQISITKLAAPQAESREFADTLAPHPHLRREELQRKLSVVTTINGQYYRLSIMEVFIEVEDIYDGVVHIMTRLFLFLGTALILFSFFITKQLFRPFQQALEKIRSFNIKNDKALDLPKTSTKEFKQLNIFLEQMMIKARRDYLSVKEFSENASHEIQTPLSIARGKLELLTETPDLSAEQVALIEATQQSLVKLSRLGKALLLLTKIDNNEFSTQKAVNFSELVNNALVHFKELAQLKNLDLRSKIENNIYLKIDPSLADILISNLLKNTIRHNLENGWIEVTLDAQQLVVSNTGAPPKVPTDQLFERFQKNRQSNGSLGLGLAIVKKICEVNYFQVQYDFEAGIHRIHVKF